MRFVSQAATVPPRSAEKNIPESNGSQRAHERLSLYPLLSPDPAFAAGRVLFWLDAAVAAECASETRTTGAAGDGGIFAAVEAKRCVCVSKMAMVRSAVQERRKRCSVRSRSIHSTELPLATVNRERRDSARDSIRDRISGSTTCLLTLGAVHRPTRTRSKSSMFVRNCGEAADGAAPPISIVGVHSLLIACRPSSASLRPKDKSASSLSCPARTTP